MQNPFNYNINELKKTANIIRQDLISMLVEAGSGHTAGPLGMADIFTAFYFNLLRYEWPYLSYSLCCYGASWIFSS